LIATTLEKTFALRINLISSFSRRSSGYPRKSVVKKSLYVPPAKALDALYIELLLWCAVWLGVIPDDLTFKANGAFDKLG
jgi:hypothetical protein